MRRYHIILTGQSLPYVTSHKFLGVVVDRVLTWTLENNRMKVRTTGIAQVLHCFASRSSCCSCSTMIVLEKALVERILRCRAPFLHGACPPTIQKLQAAQNVALKVSLGLLKCESGPGSIVETGSKPISVLTSEVSLSVHLHHLTQHKYHHLVNVVKR